MSYTTKLEKLQNSEVSLEVEVSWDELEKSYKKTLKEIQENAQLDGFRKGNAPEKVVLEKFGELYILGEAANDKIEALYPTLITENNLNSIGYPEISIVKIALNNPLVFKLKIALLPKAELGDYKGIAKKVNKDKKEVKIEDKEIDETLEQIRKNRAHHKLHESGTPHDHGDDKDLKLEELNDEFAKSLGEFKDLADLKQKISENILEEKKIKEIQRVRVETLEKIIEKTKLEIPNVLAENEIDKMLNEYKDNIAQYGFKYEDYLKQTKTTEEKIKQEWRPEAEKRAKFNVILAEIAVAEKLSPSKDLVESETAQLLANYTEINPNHAKTYVERMLTNEEVFKFLENQK